MPPVIDADASDELRCALAPADTIKVMEAIRMNEYTTVLMLTGRSFGRQGVILLEN